MQTKGLRRIRKPNYTREETEILLDQLLTYGNFLFGKSQPSLSNQQRADVWANIASLVNAVPNSAGRTVDELKHRWQDLAQRARTALRKNSNGNQELLVKQMPYMEKVLKIMGEIRPDTVSSKGIHSPASSLDTSDIDSFKVEIKQESLDGGREGQQDSHHSGNTPRKRVLPPLKTPSLKRLKENSHYESTSVTPLSSYCQNGIASLAASFPSLSHSLATDTSRLSASQADGEDDRKNTHGSSFPKQRHSELARPMVMDPESHLIMEVDLMDAGNRSPFSAEPHDEDGMYSNKEESLISPETDHPHTKDSLSNVNTRPYINENGKFGDIPGHSGLQKEALKSAGSSYLGHHLSDLEHDSDETLELLHLEHSSKTQLERLCLISKIRLQNQQRRYVKLKEKKLLMEMEAMKNKSFTSHMFPNNAPSSRLPCYSALDLHTSEEHPPVSSLTSASARETNENNYNRKSSHEEAELDEKDESCIESKNTENVDVREYQCTKTAGENHMSQEQLSDDTELSGSSFDSPKPSPHKDSES